MERSRRGVSYKRSFFFHEGRILLRERKGNRVQNARNGRGRRLIRRETPQEAKKTTAEKRPSLRKGRAKGSPLELR